MNPVRGSCCCVCGASDARLLVDIDLVDGVRVTLCGSHALMHRRAEGRAFGEADLRAILRDRRGRRDRRSDGDELGAALTHAFTANRRVGDRRR